MSNELDNLPGWAAKLSRLFSYVAALAILCLMTLVFVSVFFRYVLGAPIVATEDLMAIFLGVTVFTAYPAVTLRRRHIKVDLLTAPIKKLPRVNRVRLIMIDIGIVAMTLFFAKRLYDQAVRFEKRETGTPLMDWPLHPFTYGFAVLLVLAAALFALRALRDRGKAESTGDEPL